MQATQSTHGPLAALFALGGVALLLLPAAHRQLHGHSHSFADVVDFEIRHRSLDALVHGGALAVLVLLLAGHVGLLRETRSGGTPAVLAVTAFGAGVALLTASLVLDGFLMPALAGQFRAAPEGSRREAVEALMHASGSAIGILMRMGLLSFGASALAWCVPLMRTGGRSGRLVGTLSGAAGALLGSLAPWASPALPSLLWRGAVS